jgi:xanthine dehydrogenase accessory factor
LACGGNIHVFVDRLDWSTYEMVRDFVLEDWAGSVVTVISGPEELLGKRIVYQRDGVTMGSLGSDLDRALLALLPETKQAQRVTLGEAVEIFVDVYRPAPSLILVGGVHVAIALSSLAKSVGYGTIVVDPRRAFGSEERFPEVDKVIQKWPKKALQEIELTQETAVALLTHDPFWTVAHSILAR